MSVPKSLLVPDPRLRAISRFPVFCLSFKNASYLDARWCTNMRARTHSLSLRDHAKILCNKDVSAWFPRWLHFGEHNTSLLCFRSTWAGCLFLLIRATELEYEKISWALEGCFDGQMVPDVVSSLVDLHRQFRHLYFSEQFKYWAQDGNFELRLHWHFWWIFSGWKNVEILAVLSEPWPIYSCKTPHCVENWTNRSCSLFPLWSLWTIPSAAQALAARGQIWHFARSVFSFVPSFHISDWFTTVHTLQRRLITRR